MPRLDDPASLADLTTYVSRAWALDPDGAVRVQADGMALAAYVSVLSGYALLGRGAVLDAATIGIAEIAEAARRHSGGAAITALRQAVWLRPIDAAPMLPSGAAFAAYAVGFLGTTSPPPCSAARGGTASRRRPVTSWCGSR